MPGEEIAEEDVTQEVGDENQTDWEGPYAVKNGIDDALRHPPRLPAQVLVQRQFASSGWTGLRLFILNWQTVFAVMPGQGS